MIQINFIQIDKDLIPYSFDIDLDETAYTLEVDYNNMYDFFTIDLLKNEEVIVLGEKLVYGKPLFLTSMYKDVPKTQIIPLDLTKQTNRITFENLNEQVFLFLVEDD